jgi:hypothetical protein
MLPYKTYFVMRRQNMSMSFAGNFGRVRNVQFTNLFNRKEHKEHKGNFGTARNVQFTARSGEIVDRTRASSLDGTNKGAVQCRAPHFRRFQHCFLSAFFA